MNFADAGETVGDKELPAVGNGSLSMHCVRLVCGACSISGEHKHLAEQVDAAACLQWNDRSTHNQCIPRCLRHPRCLPEYASLLVFDDVD